MLQKYSLLSRLYCSYSQEIVNFGKRSFKIYIFVSELNLKHCKRLHCPICRSIQPKYILNNREKRLAAYLRDQLTNNQLFGCKTKEVNVIAIYTEV